MIAGDQSEVVHFLSSPSTHGGATVEQVETHTAIVFLAGTRGYKLKRAVRFDYLDFSTLDRRRRFCEEEVRLNRRTAPALYRGVLPVSRQRDGSLALGGSGSVVEWVIDMNRFDQARLFDRLAAAGALDVGLMPELAAAIARFHKAAEVRMDHGGRNGMAWVIDGNAAGFADFGACVLDSSLSARVVSGARKELDRCADLLDRRRQSGLVRQCHGDLHLRNIVLIDGQPTLFDGVEFNDEISCIDVFYDLAFLLMDLWRRRLPRHANAVLNRYLEETGDFEALRLLPLFLSCRAAVRAKTSATAARMQDDPRRRQEQQDTSAEYLAMANQLLHPPGPCLVAVGGFSGSGKSTVARELAPTVGAAPGAMLFRSDEIRKRICGVSPWQPLGPEGYSAEVSARVYDALRAYARMTVGTGHSAIIDAVHARPEERRAIEEVAAEASVPFIGCWLDAPESTLIARAEHRRGDPSDADASVIRRQLEQEAGLIAWHRIDASTSLVAVIDLVSHVLRRAAPDAIAPASSPPGSR